MKRIFLAFVCSLWIAVSSSAAGPCVVPGQGHFRINVGTGGVFGAFAHDHEIEAKKIEGCATVDEKDLTHSSIKLTFATADIKVLDPKETDKNRTEIQKTMETDVLSISQFPQVTFESTGVERAAGDQLRVRGNLKIHGQTKPVVIPLTVTHAADGTYRAVGKYAFKQTDFGIKPIKIMGGTVKVKDEVQTEFEIVLR